MCLRTRSSVKKCGCLGVLLSVNVFSETQAMREGACCSHERTVVSPALIKQHCSAGSRRMGPRCVRPKRCTMSG